MPILAAPADDFAPLAGTWEPAPTGRHLSLRAAGPVGAAHRRHAGRTAHRAVGLQRVQRAGRWNGRCRALSDGTDPGSGAAPWVAVEDEEGPRVVRAQRYVQIQCDVWSRYPGRSPVLRALQIGRLRFQLDGRQRPLRTAPLRTRMRHA